MIYLLLLEIGLIASHIAAHKHHFTNIFFSFAMTFILKKLMKSMEEKGKAGMIGLAGYSIVLSHIILYLGDVIKASKVSSPLDFNIEDFMIDRRLEDFNLDKNFKPSFKPEIKIDKFLK